MDSPTAIALTSFIAWIIVLIVTMEIGRGKALVAKQLTVREITPGNSNQSAFMQRLSRVHANCLEGFPIFGGLMLVALITGNAELTNGLAFVFLAARISQSIVHLSSVSTFMINLRFTFFAVQMAIAIYWVISLLQQLLG